MYQPGSGTSFTDTKLKADVERRIEWLGAMNDRRRSCLANNDAPGLLQLASEYDTRNMTQTAAALRLAVGKMRRK